MIKKIKEYLEYRQNLKTVRRELAEMGAAVLPTVRETAENGTELMDFLIRLASETKKISDDQLVETVLREITKGGMR
ncbi:MAG: hypothetical protein ACI39R_06945 [Lachnospiraceae bacterium]